MTVKDYALYWYCKHCSVSKDTNDYINCIPAVLLLTVYAVLIMRMWARACSKLI